MSIKNFGSEELNEIVKKLKTTSDARRKYEYVLWLAKKLPSMPNELLQDSIKVRGCVSQVYVLGELIEGRMHWLGHSDALITKGLLALLIQGLSDLTPDQVIAVNPAFIEATGLKGSLTPSRANGFLNILLQMQAQAKKGSLKTKDKSSTISNLKSSNKRN